MNSVSVNIDIKVKCDGNCANCKYDLLPSECEPWDEAINKLVKTLGFKYIILQKINDFFNKLKYEKECRHDESKTAEKGTEKPETQ